jgi:hypothetical protein
MRAFITALAVFVLSQGALAQQSVKTDPMGAPDAQANSETEIIRRLQHFAKKLEQAGFKDIQVVSEGLVLQAKDKFDKPIMMLVNPETMVAILLESRPERETTGSGSGEENK